MTETTEPEGAAEGESVSRETPTMSRREARKGAEVSDLEQEGDIAADYLEGLLDIADLDGDIDMDVEGDRALVSIVGGDLEHLVGENGKVLDALQDLTRLAVHQQSGERSRLILDVADYRSNRRKELALLAVEAVGQVRTSIARSPSMSAMSSSPSR